MDKIVLDPGQDRIVNDLFVWVVMDKRSGLEGIFGMKLAGGEFQAVSSSRQTAERLAEHIKDLPFADKRFRLVRYVPSDTVMEL